MGWCGARSTSATWQHGTISPCSSETVTSVVLLLLAVGTLWAAFRRVRLLRGYETDRRRIQLGSLAALILLSASHLVWVVLFCITKQAPFQTVFEVTSVFVWAAATVSFLILSQSSMSRNPPVQSSLVAPRRSSLSQQWATRLRLRLSDVYKWSLLEELSLLHFKCPRMPA